MFDRLVGSPLRLEQVAHVEQEVGVARLERERAAIRLLRAPGIARLLGDVAELDPDWEMIVVARKVGAVMLGRLQPLAAVARGVAEIAQAGPAPAATQSLTEPTRHHVS